jgi:dUTP pyrophosphatase
MVTQPDGKMTIRFKKLHPDAKAPYQATQGSAGFDLTATSKETKKDSCLRYVVEYGTGLAVEIPAGHVGLVFPRSSIYKKDMLLTNGVGVIDSDYRGEIKAVFAGVKEGDAYQLGDRIAQLVIMPIPAVEFVEAEELTDTERGTGGYGSTGK